MSNPKNSLQLALEKGKRKTRPLTVLEGDQEEALREADEVGRTLPAKLRRGRPPKGAAKAPSRSVTVRFPEGEAQLILRTADDQGLTLSEFVRAAAFRAASAKGPRFPASSTTKAKAPAPKKPLKV